MHVELEIGRTLLVFLGNVISFQLVACFCGFQQPRGANLGRQSSQVLPVGMSGRLPVGSGGDQIDGFQSEAVSHNILGLGSHSWAWEVILGDVR